MCLGVSKFFLYYFFFFLTIFLGKGDKSAGMHNCQVVVHNVGGGGHKGGLEEDGGCGGRE